MTEHVIEVKDIDHWNSILDNNSEVVVRFTADWCGPCKQFAPAFNGAAERHPATFAVIDIEAVPELAVAWNVMSIPAVKHFVDGQYHGDIDISGSKRTLVNFLNTLNNL